MSQQPAHHDVALTWISARTLCPLCSTCALAARCEWRRFVEAAGAFGLEPDMRGLTSQAGLSQMNRCRLQQCHLAHQQPRASAWQPWWPPTRPGVRQLLLLLAPPFP